MANSGHRAARSRGLLILWSALLYQLCSRFRGGLILTSIWGLYLLAVQSGAREASTDREKLLDFRGLLCTSEEKNIKHITRLPRLIITAHSYFLSKLIGKPNRVNCPHCLGIDGYPSKPEELQSTFHSELLREGTFGKGRGESVANNATDSRQTWR